MCSCDAWYSVLTSPLRYINFLWTMCMSRPKDLGIFLPPFISSYCRTRTTYQFCHLVLAYPIPSSPSGKGGVICTCPWRNWQGHAFGPWVMIKWVVHAVIRAGLYLSGRQSKQRCMVSHYPTQVIVSNFQMDNLIYHCHVFSWPLSAGWSFCIVFLPAAADLLHTQSCPVLLRYF